MNRHDRWYNRDMFVNFRSMFRFCYQFEEHVANRKGQGITWSFGKSGFGFGSARKTWSFKRIWFGYNDTGNSRCTLSYTVICP